MGKSTIYLIITFVLMGLIINSSIQNKNKVCEFELNNLNNELISINELSKNLLLEENIENTKNYYDVMLKTGINICQGNELLFYGTGFDLEEQQYKTICYNKKPLKFKYFSLNSLIKGLD